MTIARIWTASIADGRTADYEKFAREISLPMFRQQDGFQGVAMMRVGNGCSVLTLWRDEKAVEQLAASQSYAGAVKAIMDAGFLDRVDEVVTSHVHLADFASLAIGIDLSAAD